MARTKQSAREENVKASRSTVASKGKKAEPAAKAPRSRAKEPASEVKQRKPHRFRPGTVALRAIRKFQKSTETLIPKAAMNRYIREVLQDIRPKGSDPLRMQATAVAILHMMTEEEITNQLQGSVMNMAHAKRKTLLLPDLQLALAQCNRYSAGISSIRYPVGIEDTSQAMNPSEKPKPKRKGVPRRNVAAAAPKPAEVAVAEPAAEEKKDEPEMASAESPAEEAEI